MSVVLLEDLLLLFGLHVEQAGEQIGEPQRIVDAGDQRRAAPATVRSTSDSARSISSCRRRT